MWAIASGYDTARAGRNFLNPMTADLWTAWQAAAATPEGWRLVPVVPTREMLDAGHHRIDFDRGDQNTYHLEHESQGRSTILRDMTEAWAAMLDAAPGRA